MYLRRFAVARSSRHQIGAAKADNIDSSFLSNIDSVGVEQGFYWGTTADGVPHHDMEAFLTEVEGLGATAFRQVLDRGNLPNEDALPRQWPPSGTARLHISWWLAAQLLRTSRQRLRLRALEDRNGLEVPPGLNASNEHLTFIATLVAPVAKLLFERPWGIGFSDACLLTSDTPALVLNGQDDPNQLDAIEYWDIYVPLDPHRCLYLPGAGLRNRLGIKGDHKLKLHPGHGLALNQAMADAAVRHVFFHPDHDLRDQLHPRTPLPLPSGGEDAQGPRYLLGGYELVPRAHGIERKWLIAHPPRRDPAAMSVADKPDSQTLEALLAMLNADESEFKPRG